MRGWYVLIAGAVALVLAGVGVVFIGLREHQAASPVAQPSATGVRATGTASPSPTARPPGCSPWGCAQDARFTAAVALIKTVTNGHVGIEVKDRVTGAVWTAGEPDYKIWAGSTPKLAFAVALREEARAGQITLDTKANMEIDEMLHISDNVAADTLWDRYANASAMMTRWRTQYGMTTATYVSGFPSRWGFVKLTPKDLVALVSYILVKLNATDRAYFVQAMQLVGTIQHWGVWGAGAVLHPGVKDGWSQEMDAGKQHWITATEGFVGPDQRYVVGAMYHQNPGGDTIDRGVHLLTDLVATVFGAPVPAPAIIPPPGT